MQQGQLEQQLALVLLAAQAQRRQQIDEEHTQGERDAAEIGDGPGQRAGRDEQQHDAGQCEAPAHRVGMHERGGVGDGADQHRQPGGLQLWTAEHPGSGRAPERGRDEQYGPPDREQAGDGRGFACAPPRERDAHEHQPDEYHAAGTREPRPIAL